MNSKRVILIDANSDRRAVWRAHLRQIPQCQLLSDFGDASRAAPVVRELRPDLVLIGHELPDSGGIHLARRLTHELPGLAVIILASEARAEDVLLALRAGVRDFLVRPTPQEVRAALGRLGQVLPADESRGTGRIITLFSPLGGVGQTSLAANVAVALRQETGRSVALVDLNGRHGQLDLHLDLHPGCSWLEAIGKGLPYDKALHLHRSGVALAVASRSADGVPAEAAQHVLATLSRRFDYVVVDADHRAGPGTLIALRQAAMTLIPLRTDLGGLRAAQLALQIGMEQQLAPERLRLVTLGTGTTGGLSLGAIGEVLRHPIAWSLPIDAGTAMAALDRGQPVVLGDPATPLATAIRRLVRDLAGLTTGEPLSPGGSFAGIRLWLRRLTSRTGELPAVRPSTGLR